MKRNARIATNRLKNVLLSDKIAHPDKFNELIKSEVITLLDNYFELYPSTFELRLNINENILDIAINVKGGRIKPHGCFITENC